MPSDKKRINLTVPDEVYEKLQTYMKENGLSSDATACLQLVVQQLRGYEQMKVFYSTMQNITKEQLQAFSVEGTGIIKDELDKLNVKKSE